MEEFARFTDRRPAFTSSLLTERSGVDDGPLAGAGFAAASDLLPRLEKFHFPEASRSKAISGLSSVISVTCKALEKIRGITSTPTFSDLARMKGSLLNAGSSAIDKSSAETLPERMERLRLPTLTSRPSASVRADSSLGRKLFTLIKKGRAMATSRRTTTMIPIIFSAFITGTPSPTLDLLREPTRRWSKPRVAHSLPKAGLLRLLRKFGIGCGAAIELFLSFVPLLVHHVRGGAHLSAGFLGPAQTLQ